MECRAAKLTIPIFVLTILTPLITSSTIKSNSGEITGITKKLNSDKEVEAFLGIPYADPPIGNLRFASPQSVTPWKSMDTTQMKPACFQFSSPDEKKTVWFASTNSESEDCLYLNIWRPINQTKMAVMIFIHGGAAMTGSASIPYYDGSVLAAEENVIVCSFDYRLLLLGELYLNIPGAPGNVYLQDQIMAITWVKNNIKHFGGNPDKITLFGEGSGAVSIGYHLTNPSVSSLFNNAIMQSGSPNYAILNSGTPNYLGLSISTDEGLKYAYQLARKVGCDADFDNRAKVLSCLQAVNVSNLISPYAFIPKNLAYPFGAVRNGLEVPLDPSVLNSATERKSLMLGTTLNEMSYLMQYFFPGKTISKNTNVTEKEWMTLINQYYNVTDNVLAKFCMQPYMDDNCNYDPQQVREEVSDFLSDSLVTCPLISFADMYISSTSNTYLYSYTHRLFNSWISVPKWAGIAQGEEIPYVFGSKANKKKKDSESIFSKEIMADWANFARNNDPNGGLPKRKTWPVYNLKDRSYMRLTVADRVLKNLRCRQCDFWNNRYKDVITLQKRLRS